jgi:sulfur carrier protein ThiS
MFTASADIRPSRFVKISGNYTVAECDANEWPIGISAEYGENAPIPSQSTEYVADSGHSCPVYTESTPIDQPVLLILGSGGATAGVLLKSDTNGAGVAVASNNDIYGAQAMEAGSSGEAIRVRIVRGYYGA